MLPRHGEGNSRVVEHLHEHAVVLGKFKILTVVIKDRWLDGGTVVWQTQYLCELFNNAGAHETFWVLRGKDGYCGADFVSTGEEFCKTGRRLDDRCNLRRVVVKVLRDGTGNFITRQVKQNDIRFFLIKVVREKLFALKGRGVVKLDPVVRELLKIQDLLQHEELKVLRVFALQADTNWIHPFADSSKALAGKLVAEGDNVEIPNECFNIGKLI